MAGWEGEFEVEGENAKIGGVGRGDGIVSVHGT